MNLKKIFTEIRSILKKNGPVFFLPDFTDDITRKPGFEWPKAYGENRCDYERQLFEIADFSNANSKHFKDNDITIRLLSQPSMEMDRYLILHKDGSYNMLFYAWRTEEWTITKPEFKIPDEEFLLLLTEIKRRTDTKELLDTELYSIEEDGDGNKTIHILAYLYLSDSYPDKKDYRLVEFTFLEMPLNEFIQKYRENGKQYVDETEEEYKQYIKDLTEEEAVNAYWQYFDEKPGLILPFSELTPDTPVGNYVNKELERPLTKKELFSRLEEINTVLAEEEDDRRHGFEEEDEEEPDDFETNANGFDINFQKRTVEFEFTVMNDKFWSERSFDSIKEEFDLDLDGYEDYFN